MGSLEKIGHLLENEEDKKQLLLEKLNFKELKILAEEIGVEVKPTIFTGRIDEARYREVLCGNPSLKFERLLDHIKKHNPKIYSEWNEREKNLSLDWSGVKKKLGGTLNKDIGTLMEAANKEENTGTEGPIGEQLEDLLEAYFKSKRYKILKRNWGVDEREVDMVVARGTKAIMIETKFRKTPISMAEHDGYMALFKKLKRRKLPNGGYIERMIYVAPYGGVAKGVLNEARTSEGEIEVWGPEFKCELIEFQKKLRNS